MLYNNKMSDIPKCELCSKTAEIVCGCIGESFFCADHIEQHVTSSNEAHILETIKNKFLQFEVQILENIKIRL